MQIPASSSSSRPHHTGGSDSSDDASDSSSSSEPVVIPEGGYTIDEATGTYHVYNADGLKAWARNPNVQGTDCTLENNIELEGEWTPIGTSEGAYKGTFDGQGHTISGLRATGTGQFVSMANGMFGEIQQGCVKDLRLENPVVTRLKDFGYGDLIPLSANNGAIVGSLKFGGQIIGCTVSNATISGSTAGGTVGGIAGSVEANTTIAGCCSVGSTVTGNTVDGGIVASVLDKNAAYLTANACYWDGGPENGVGSNPDHQGVTKVDGNTTKWADAVKAMQTASSCRFEVDASGKPTGVG